MTYFPSHILMNSMAFAHQMISHILQNFYICAVMKWYTHNSLKNMLNYDTKIGSQRARRDLIGIIRNYTFIWNESVRLLQIKPFDKTYDMLIFPVIIEHINLRNFLMLQQLNISLDIMNHVFHYANIYIQLCRDACPYIHT